MGRVFRVRWEIDFDEQEGMRTPEDAVRAAAELFHSQSLDPDAYLPIFTCDGLAFEENFGVVTPYPRVVESSGRKVEGL